LFNGLGTFGVWRGRGVSVIPRAVFGMEGGVLGWWGGNFDMFSDVGFRSGLNSAPFTWVDYL
jgi:hypothetical protein